MTAEQKVARPIPLRVDRRSVAALRRRHARELLHALPIPSSDGPFDEVLQDAHRVADDTYAQACLALRAAERRGDRWAVESAGARARALRAVAHLVRHHAIAVTLSEVRRESAGPPLAAVLDAEAQVDAWLDESRAWPGSR